MDYIEDLYQYLGIKRQERFYCANGYCNQSPARRKDYEQCKGCENSVYYSSPEFTPRKQMEILSICKEVAPEKTSTAIFDRLILEQAIAKVARELIFIGLIDKEKVTEILKEVLG
jgi:hypothetical protein